jgi:hypothetical protein
MVCEKCWGDAFKRAQMLGGEQSKHYHDLLAERVLHPCTPDEQAGIVRCPKHGVMYGYCSECIGGE